MRLHQSSTSSAQVVRFTDHRGARHAWSLFESKPESELFAARLGRLIDARSMSCAVPGELRGWVLGLPSRLRAHLADANLLDSDTIAAATPLTEVLTQWRDDLAAQGNTEQHCNQSTHRVTRVLEKCRAETVNEVSSRDVEMGVSEVRRDKELSPATANKYLADTKSFFRWCGSRRFAIDPSILLLRPYRAPRREYERRALSVGEARALVSQTERMGVVHHRSSGEQRGLLYRFLLQTGLRAGEVRQVTWSRIDWSRGLLYLEPEKTKARRSDTLPLGMDLLKRLSVAASASRSVLVFPWLPSRSRMVKMLREDLDACGVLWRASDNPQGCVDMHSLRKTHADLVLAGGASTRTAMDMLRHTSPAMTMHYATAKLDDMRRVAGSVEMQLDGVLHDSSVVQWQNTGTAGPREVPRKNLGQQTPETQVRFLAEVPPTDPTTFRELTAYLSRFSPDVLLQALREVGLQPTL